MSLLDFIVGNAQGMAVPQQAPATAVAPTPAPAARSQRRQPSALDMIFGVAAGYSPGTTRQRFNQRELEGAKAEAELGGLERASAERASVLNSISDPMQRAIAAANMPKWGEFAGERYIKPHSLSRGAQLTTGDGKLLASNNFTHTLGDVEIVEIMPDGTRVSHVRENLSPSEIAKIEDQNIKRQEMAQNHQIAQGQLGVAQQNADTTQGQLALARETLDEERGQRRATQNLAHENMSAAERVATNTLTNGIQGIRDNISGAGIWTTYNPLQRQSRASLEAQLNAVKGVLSVDALSELKQSSPNGASGLGSMTEKEGEWLGGRIAALNVDMRPEELETSLKEIEGFLGEIAARGQRRAASLPQNRNRTSPATQAAVAGVSPPSQRSSSTPQPPPGFRIVR